VAKKNGKERNDGSLVSRREMLRRLGNYSAIAAGVLAAPSALLFTGCGGGGGGGPSGDSPDDAIPIRLGDSFSNITLDVDVDYDIYFVLDAQDGSVEAAINVTSVTGECSDAIVCTLLDSNLDVVDAPVSLDEPITIELDLDPGIYYIVFECECGTATFSFELLDTSPPEWSNTYSDWNDTYSDWSNTWDNYSDWSNTWDNYSDWSDTWNNYSIWQDAWNNYSVWMNTF